MISQKVECNICGFPRFIPEAPNSKIGELMFMGRTTVECLKQHFLQHHPHDYKSLLQEIQKSEVS